MPHEVEPDAQLSRTTPFPNRLIDAVMPRLRDSEWRVLTVVVRQTLGWIEGTGRKDRDWLSHSQLKRRTGRAGAAVSKAVARLVELDLIEVFDSSGSLVASPGARRHAKSRLFYSLGMAVDNLEKSEFSKAKTTKAIYTKVDRAAKLKARRAQLRIHHGWRQAGLFEPSEKDTCV